MSAYVHFPYTSGETVSIALLAPATNYWYVAGTGVPEAYDNSHLATYKTACTEFGATGVYYVVIPTLATLPAKVNFALFDDTTGECFSLGGPVFLTAANAEIQLDMTQPFPTSNTAETLGDALNAARANAFGKMVKTGTTLVIYASNGSTALKTFTLDSSTNPQSRT